MNRFAPLAVALALLAPPLYAATPSSWEARRTSSPDSIEELKALQEKVKGVTAKVMPSTVGLVMGFGAGSGVIVSDDGLVLTAAHVIAKPDADLIIVLADGTQVKGKALGLSDKLDSGMAKITSKVPKDATWPGAKEGKWPKVELGDSDALKKGQWVISLGHHGGPRKERTPPLRLGRFLNTGERGNVLQTDCTLVGGDSGGPLFDLDGKLVGIHSKIGITLDSNMHVPVDKFKPDWAELVEGVALDRKAASLGADLDTDLDAPTVLGVAKDSAADKGGLQEGDVIVKFKGDRVATRDDLKKMLAESKPDQNVTVEVKRGEETVKLKIKLEAAKARPKGKSGR